MSRSPSQALLASTYYNKDYSICIWFKHGTSTKPLGTNVAATSLGRRQIYCQNIFHHWRSFMTRFVGFDSFNGSWLESSSFVELLQPTLKELKGLKSQAKEARNFATLMLFLSCSDLSRFLCTVGTVGARCCCRCFCFMQYFNCTAILGDLT